MRRAGWLLAILSLACSEEPVAPGQLVPVDRVVVLSANSGILLGETLALQAVGLSADGDTLPGRQVSWTTSDPGIIALSPGGQATALAEGDATVMATIEGQTAEGTVSAIRLEFEDISAGSGHTCGVTVQRQGWCWGINGTGELGLGAPDFLDHRIPQRVVGTQQWQVIRSGTGATCGLAIGSSAWCWGSNYTGELGNGSTAEADSPVPVTGNINFTDITTPQGHTCALAVGGAGYCWGDNSYGNLGDGSRQQRLTAVAVQGGLTFSAVSTTSPYFSCGLQSGGTAACWGAGSYLGNDTTYYNTSPYPVSGGHSFVQLSARYYRTCGLDGNGSVQCWGFKPIDEGGRESNVPTPEPAPVMFASISEGIEHSCGLTPQGEAWCWGANSSGQLGTGTLGSQSINYPAAPVSGGHTFLSISAGDYYTCGLVATGDAYCWGSNYNGALGTGNATTFVTTPDLVTGGHSFTTISADNPACAIDTAGTAWCWGYGELGSGSNFSASPVQVSGGLVFDSITAGQSNTCGLVAGAAWCWGSNYNGQIGNGVQFGYEALPVQVSGGHTFTQVAVGEGFICALDVTGGAWCWGSNRHGTVGDGTEIQRNVPTAVLGGLTFTDIAVGSEHVCAITTGGATYCWGDNSLGQIGNGVTPDSPFPLQVDGGFSFTQVATSYYSSCGLTASSDVYCWPKSNSPLPGLLPGGVKFSSITMGYSHSCGLTSGGAAYCWGENHGGQLGNGSVLPYGQVQSTPVAVTGGQVFRTISAGSEYTCAITTGNVAYCWGSNYNGQLGISGFEGVTVIPSPVKIRGQP